MRRTALFSLSLALTMAMIFAGAGGAAAAGGHGGGHGHGFSGVKWMPTALHLTLAPGASSTSTVTVTAGMTLTDVTYAVVPTNTLLSVTVSGLPSSLNPGAPVALSVAVTAPATLSRRGLDAEVVLLNNGRPVARTLGITVTPPPPPHITWKPGSVAVKVAPGATATAEVSVESSQALTDVTFATTARPVSITLEVLNAPSSLAANTPVMITISVSVPAGFRGRVGEGKVAVIANGLGVRSTLAVVIKISAGGHGHGHGGGR